MHLDLAQKPKKERLAPHAAGGPIIALMRAAADGDAVMALGLLALASTDILARDPSGWDALTWAARNGRTECLRILLKSHPCLTEDILSVPMRKAGFFGRHDCAELIAMALDPSTERALRSLGFEAAIEGGHEHCAYSIAEANLCIHERREAAQISAAAPEAGSESNAGRPRI